MNMDFTTWEILAVLGVAFVVLEMLTITFYFLPIAIGFFITAAVATEYDSWAVLTAVFALGVGMSLIVVRKTLAKYHQKASTLTNYEGLVGKEVEVVRAIESRKPGTVKLYGDTWTATGQDGSEFKVGDFVVIRDVQGNKVTVGSIN